LTAMTICIDQIANPFDEYDIDVLVKLLESRGGVFNPVEDG